MKPHKDPIDASSFGVHPRCAHEFNKCGTLCAPEKEREREAWSEKDPLVWFVYTMEQNNAGRIEPGPCAVRVSLEILSYGGDLAHTSLPVFNILTCAARISA